MKETDIAWAAGFLDGEGCFHMYESTSKGHSSVRAAIKANQAIHRAPIEKLHNLFGGSIWERNQKTVTNKPVYEWQVQSADAILRIIPLIAPYLIVKKPQAELILELSQYRQKHYGRGGNPNKDKQIEVLHRFDKLRWQA